MRVIIEESAVADIDGLAAWVGKDSPRRGRLVVEQILHTIERLEDFPEIGHAGREEGTYERGVSGTPYIIVYEVGKQPNAVLVISVVHGSRNR
jgi:plasmid stabilization system protein ParE